MSGDLRMSVVGGDLLAQLEDGQTDGDDEGEEGQLEGVPGLQSQDTEGEWHQGHRFKEHEHQDGDEDLLQFGFTCCKTTKRLLSFGVGWLGGWLTFLYAVAEVDFEVDFVVVQVSGGQSDGTDGGQFECGIVALDVLFNVVLN